MKKICLGLFVILLSSKAISQQKALYTIRINHDYKKWEQGCETCLTHYTAYPYFGLTSSNGGMIDDIYTLDGLEMDLTYFEKRSYSYYDG